MCGFAGLLNPETNQPAEWYLARINKMADAIRHRGPDDGDFWHDTSRGVSLGFRRLSILDLSENGRQPMPSACGRYIVMLNGEIYNHHSLRSEIEKSGQFPFSFKGRSDTEVLTAAISVWGFETTLSKLNGMFAIAVWDKKEKNLLLARDRMGEKPLFFGWLKDFFVFGSELKSISALDDFHGGIDRKALNLFFRHSCIPAPYTPFEKIYKLRPASFLVVDRFGKVQKEAQYWILKKFFESESSRFKRTLTEVQNEILTVLKDSIRIRMESDVPLGAFLSGGIDSSLVVALMQEQSSRAIQTFTIGFEEAQFNEAHYASQISKHLGTDHTELTVTSKEAQEVIPLIPRMMDEPFSDASVIPSYLVSKLARHKVTVCLSGDGGDELFGGYDRYLWGNIFWNRFSEVGVQYKTQLAEVLGFLTPHHWNQAFLFFQTILPKQLRWTNPGEKIQKLKEALRAKNVHELYVLLTSHFNPPSEITLCKDEPKTLISENYHGADDTELLNQMMYWDLVSYLPDDILTKMDRATMAVSLEGRMPLLDHRLVELSATLPGNFKIHQNNTKYFLKNILSLYVPPSFFERPKMGFSVPVGDWIKGPLRDWAESLLSQKRLESEGFLSPNVVRTKWEQHLGGARNWQHQLWDVLMFQEWLSNCK